VAVGALGGSGTRVFARVLMDLGYYLGAWRNAADDNLLVSELLKDPEAAASGGYDQRRAVDRFVRSMQGALPGWTDYQAVHETRSVCGKPAGVRPTLAVTRRLLQTAIGARRGDHVGWGWKEPFTHLFLDAFAARVPDLRYVHVLRHGLDMAYSANRSQLDRFAARFGVPVPRAPADVPVAQLRLWLATTERVLEVAPRLFGDRFLLMRYDDLVTRPHDEIARLAGFLGIADTGWDDVAAGISATSIGRYRDQDLSVFPADLLAQVEANGFAVDA
jgi:hypothetical protein